MTVINVDTASEQVTYVHRCTMTERTDRYVREGNILSVQCGCGDTVFLRMPEDEKRDGDELAADYDHVVARWQQSDLEDADIVLHNLYDGLVAWKHAVERCEDANREVRYQRDQLRAMVDAAERKMDDEEDE